MEPILSGGRAGAGAEERDTAAFCVCQDGRGVRAGGEGVGGGPGVGDVPQSEDGGRAEGADPGGGTQRGSGAPVRRLHQLLIRVRGG